MARYATTEEFLNCRCGIKFAMRAEYIICYHRKKNKFVQGVTRRCPDRCFKYHTAHNYKCPNCGNVFGIINTAHDDYLCGDAPRSAMVPHLGIGTNG